MTKQEWKDLEEFYAQKSDVVGVIDFDTGEVEMIDADKFFPEEAPDPDDYDSDDDSPKGSDGAGRRPGRVRAREK